MTGDHLDSRLDSLEAYTQATRAMATETRDIMREELVKVQIRRPQLDARLDRIEAVLEKLTEAQRETNDLIDRAILLARFARWTATGVAAVGASILGFAGWWAELKAWAGWK